MGLQKMIRLISDEYMFLYSSNIFLTFVFSASRENND